MFMAFYEQIFKYQNKRQFISKELITLISAENFGLFLKSKLQNT